MEKNSNKYENEDDIDVRKIYLTNFKQHQPRIGKEYQAVIPECIGRPKNNEQSNNTDKKINDNKNDIKLNKYEIKTNNNEEENKNTILGRKTEKSKKDVPSSGNFAKNKKKKII